VGDDGKIARAGYTSVWTKHQLSPSFLCCEACGRINRLTGEERICNCGAALPEPMPFW
jgi:hypothetical protein